MDERYQGLLELQELDEELEQARTKVQEFEPQLEELEAPVEAAQREVDLVQTRLTELRDEVRRLERLEKEKQERLARYDERLMQVRTSREEAAVRTEIDLIRRALEADRQDIKQLSEQAMRTELKLDELKKELARLRSEMEPKREALIAERQAAADSVDVLEGRRENHVVRLDKDVLRLYERVKAGRTRMVLVALTVDGACGSCFNVIPVQEQSEIRQGARLTRCEACGVILYPQD